MDEFKECTICLNKYDANDYKPCIISPCGHYLCSFCITKINSCPLCRTKIRSKILNRHILNLIELEKTEKPMSNFQLLKKSLMDDVLKLENDLETARDKFTKKTQDLSSQMKKDIEIQKQSRIAAIERDAKELLDKVNDNEKIIMEKLNSKTACFGNSNKEDITMLENALTSISAYKIAENIKEKFSKHVKIFEDSSFSFSFIARSSLNGQNQIGEIFKTYERSIERYFLH